MSRKIIRTLLLLGFLIFLWVSPASAQEPSEDKFVFGGVYTLKADESLDGNLVVFGGLVTLENGSTLNGDVVSFGGSLTCNGRINGDIVSLGSVVDLQDQAVINGNVNSVGGDYKQSPLARVEGEANTNIQGPFSFAPSGIWHVPELQDSFRPIWSALWFIFRCFLWAALAALVTIFVPKPVDRVTQAVINQPVVAGGVGLMTVVVMPIILVGVAITIIGIPLTIFGFLILAAAWAYGVIAIGAEVGRRLTGAFHQVWAPPASAAFGVFFLVFVLDGVRLLVPCVGWILPALAGMLGLGAVILTRFGSQVYPPFPPMRYAPPERDPLRENASTPSALDSPEEFPQP